ncbi:MAG: hypothetical protein ABIR46_03250 [Candidatus Saccharimonadales bacterium]
MRPFRKSQPATPVRQPRFQDGTEAVFRRSRTLTGSANDTVRAANESRGQLQSPRLHEHGLRAHRRKLAAYLLASLTVCGMLWYVVSSYIGGGISVGTSMTQPLATELDEARYQSLVDTYLGNHPLEYFQFALDADTFNQYIQSQASEVANASLTRGEGIGQAQLILTLREPVIAWTIKNQQYFVDASGHAYTKNYFATPQVVVSDKSGVSADAGVVASTKLLRFIGRVTVLVNQSGTLRVERIELPPGSTRQVDFKLADRPYIIKAHLDRDPAGQAADIVNAVGHIETHAINPAYVDVRVSSKAFYTDKSQ